MLTIINILSYILICMVNVDKINKRMDDLKMTKAELLKKAGFTRVTLDKILKGGEANVSTIEALAKGLGVRVGFFFDEEEIVPMKIDNKAEGNGTAQAAVFGDTNISANRSEHDELIQLRVENKGLKTQIAEKDALIAELQKMNNFLMEKKNG